MKTIEEVAQEYADEICSIESDIRGIESKDINDYLQDAIYAGVEYAQQWIFEIAKNKRKIIRDMLFDIYDKGVKNEECNLDFYYEKMMQALNIPYKRS